MQDIENLYKNYDYTVLNDIIKEVINNKNVERLQRQLDIAEAINFGYTGSKPSKGKKNQRDYARWQKRKYKRILKIQGRNEKGQTLWDKLKELKRPKKRSMRL